MTDPFPFLHQKSIPEINYFDLKLRVKKVLIFIININENIFKMQVSMAQVDLLQLPHLLSDLDDQPDPRDWTLPEDAVRVFNDFVPHHPFIERQGEAHYISPHLQQMVNYLPLLLL